jgi:predicted SAM-dependent methyltransferase
MNKLNLGCGNDIRPGYVNLDIVDYGGNMIHDINTFPYPFPDNYFDEIYASHVLEHLNSFHNTVTELYRISKPGGILEVYAPFFLIQNISVNLIIKFLSRSGLSIIMNI